MPQCSVRNRPVSYTTYNICPKRSEISFGHAISFVHPFRTENDAMSRVFAYCRVSTLEQTTENQRREIEAADAEAFVRELAQRVPQHGDALMTIAQQLEQKGIEKGRAEGQG